MSQLARELDNATTLSYAQRVMVGEQGTRVVLRPMCRGTGKNGY